MNSDSFEQKLARQPLRKVPATWREDILCAARKAEASRRSSTALRRSLLPTLNRHLSSLLWPHPRAWAGLAAVWVLILVVNVATRDESNMIAASRVAPPSPQLRELLRQQEQLLAELIGPIEEPEADRRKSPAPQPRGQRRDECMNA